MIVNKIHGKTIRRAFVNVYEDAYSIDLTFTDGTQFSVTSHIQVSAITQFYRNEKDDKPKTWEL